MRVPFNVLVVCRLVVVLVLRALSSNVLLFLFKDIPYRILKLAPSLRAVPQSIGATVWMDKQGRILLARSGIVNGGWPLPRCHRRARPRVRRALPRAHIDRPLSSKAAAVTMEISAHIVSLQSGQGGRGEPLSGVS